MIDIPLRVIGAELRVKVGNSGWPVPPAPIEAMLVPLEIDWPTMLDGRHQQLQPQMEITLHTTRGDVTVTATLPPPNMGPHLAGWINPSEMEDAYGELAASVVRHR